MSTTTVQRRLSEVPLIERLFMLLAVRNAVRHGVDEGLLLQTVDVDSLCAILRDNERRDGAAPVPWRVRLRPMEPADLPLVYRAWCDPAAGALWRSAGSTPPWSELEEHLWAGTDTLFVGEGADDGRPLALLCSYAENLAGGWTYAAELRLDLDGDAGPFVATEGLYLFLRHLYRSKPYRKVMLEIPAHSFWMAEGVVPEHDVTVFPRHRFSGGRYVDVAHVHVWREHWDRLREAVDVAPEDLEPWLRAHVGPG